MRYDNTVPFYSDRSTFYNEIDCNIAEMETEQAKVIFGDTKINRLIVCMKEALPFRTGYLEFEGKTYKMASSQKMRNRFTHYVEEHKAGLEL